MDRLPRPPDPTGRVLHGFEHNEDAVILRSPPPGMALVQTVDVLAPIGNNPRRFGQTAAANALSDVYAVGGEPWAAMNILAFPASDLPLDVAAEILAGGLEKIAEAGAVLAGGHTLEDEEIKYGLCPPRAGGKQCRACPWRRACADQAPGHRGAGHGRKGRLAGQ